MSRFFLMLFFVFCTSLDAATLHTFIVADTCDEDIGFSVALDAKMMRSEMKQIAIQSGMEFKEYCYTDEKMSTRQVWDGLHALEVDKNDTVLFYFSGHGFRTKKKIPEWPNLYFSSEHKGIDVEDVVRHLQGKGGRLTLVITDACNTYLSCLFSPLLVAKGKFFAIQGVDHHLRALFFEASGTIVVNSSKTGEPSWATAQGGVFTIALMKQIKRARYLSSRPTWEEIFMLTSSAIQEYQTPIYQLTE